MIALYCPDHALRNAIQQHLPSSRAEYIDWHAFRRATPGVEIAIVGLSALTERAADRIEKLRKGYVGLSVILVTDDSPANHMRMARVSVDALVWTSAVAVDLPTAISEGRARGLLRKVANAVDAASVGMPALTRRAFDIICNSDVPIFTVSSLALEADSTRSTLNRQWRSAVRESAGLRLQDFLHWHLLLRAVAHHGSPFDSTAAARRLGMGRKTLERQAMHLTGYPIEALAAAGHDRVIALFRDRVLRLLLKNRTCGILDEHAS